MDTVEDSTEDLFAISRTPKHGKASYVILPKWVYSKTRR